MAQVVADRLVMLAHLLQQRFDCVPNRMLAHAAGSEVS
jgi:hypothetical protein